MVGEVVMKKINIILFMMISACSLYGCTQSSNSVDKLNDKSTEISSEYDDSQKLIADNNAEKEYEIPDKYDTVFWVDLSIFWLTVSNDQNAHIMQNTLKYGTHSTHLLDNKIIIIGFAHTNNPAIIGNII